MKKSSIKQLLPILLVLFLTGCGSQKVSSARTAYTNGDYQAVIAALEGVELTEDADRNMLLSAKAQVAYAAQNYEEVVTLLGEGPCEDNDLENIRQLSKGQIAYAAQDYETVLETLGDRDDRDNLEIYSLAQKSVLRESVQAQNIESVIQILNDTPALQDTVVSDVSEACGGMDYSAFLFLDQLIEELPEGECRNALSTYAGENAVLRLQAFLNGTWEWHEEGDSEPAVVELTVQSDGTGIGILKRVSPAQVKYGFETGDIYWKDFHYLSGNTFACSHLLRTTEGGVIEGYAYTTADFDRGVIHVHITPVTGTVQNQDREWTRCEKTVEPD